MSEREKWVRPYGDRLNDGAVQISFSLPAPLSPRSKEGAKAIALGMGLSHLRLIASLDLGNGFSFYVIYGVTDQSLDIQAIHVAEVEHPLLDFWRINHLLEFELKMKVTVIGATIGTDAHTVGLDAILNAKGFSGDSGLERFPQFRVINMGAQVPPEEVAEAVQTEHADVVLVSQVVTQRNAHLENLSQLSEILEAEGLRQDLLLVCGGPFIDAQVALEVGFDAGFGSGTTPLQVASWIVSELLRRHR
jgi:beta-lysine 5,6-aminomutase beta subunit